MIKLASLQKNSFTLIELLLSLSILALLSAYILYTKKDFSKEYKTLEKLENSFLTKSYDEFSKTSTTVEIYTDGIKSEMEVQKIEYKDENIKIFKYDF